MQTGVREGLSGKPATPQKGVFEQGFGGCSGIFGGTLGEALTGSSVVVPLGLTHCSLGPRPEDSRQSTMVCFYNALSWQNPSGAYVLSQVSSQEGTKAMKMPVLGSKQRAFGTYQLCAKC